MCLAVQKGLIVHILSIAGLPGLLVNKIRIKQKKTARNEGLSFFGSGKEDRVL